LSQVEYLRNSVILSNALDYRLNNLRKYNEAIECYDKALEIDPKYVYALNNKGLALDNLRKYNEAIECYDKALKIDPKYAWAWLNKGLALGNLKKYKEAIECYDKAIEIDPNFIVIACYNKANALYYLKYYDQAIECYDKAAKVEYAGSETDPINIIRIKVWLSKIKDMMIEEQHEMSGE
jgi:tetratricopeptide (TPR) repeat protein